MIRQTMRFVVFILIGLVGFIPQTFAGCLPQNEIGRGIASWYGPGFEGNLTSNETAFDPYALTAAHPSLPFGTRLKVMNLRTAQSVEVVINDRGHFSQGRLIDVSKGAASALGMVTSGVAPVALYACR